ncbi:hypothetical protein [Kribbella sp. NBC_00359]|uniref:hypothetical protein n=1 Tax=Kribbella sp. NBC_00359 TaxID=2975966 RepID=UPI002E1CDDF4
MVNVAFNVLAELGTATWTGPQAIAYETAQEGVRQAIGYYTRLIETATEPDADAVAGWRAEQQAWAARGQELTPLDTRAIKRIRLDADTLLSVEEHDDDEDETDDAGERDDEDDFDAVAGDEDAGDNEVLGRA